MDKKSAKIGVETTLAVVIRCAILVVGLAKNGFRPKDVMFYLDLVKDVVQRNRADSAVVIQFVQVQRWLQKYEDLGWVSRQLKDEVATFRLKTAGVKGLLQALIPDDRLIDPAEAFFLQQMLDSYGPILEAKLSGKEPRKAAEPWLKALLQPAFVLQNQIKNLDVMIRHHERRCADSLQLQSYCKRALAAGKSPAEVVAQMPAEFSYQLSHQKTFREFLGEIPPSLAEFELSQGFALRHQRLYLPNLEFLKMQRQFYSDLIKS